MAMLPKPAPLGEAWADVRDFVLQRRPHQWVFAALAVTIPILVIAAFMKQFTLVKPYVPPTVIFADQWTAGRTVEEIRAKQAKDLPAELARKKAEADAIERRKAMFRKLEKQYKSIVG